MKFYIQSFILFICLSLISCASTNKMSLSVKEPARVTLRDNIHKIGIIDRSQVRKENATIDQFDRILTLESKGMDSTGRIKQINKLNETILNNKKIDSTVVIIEQDLFNTNPTNFGTSLDQTTIKSLCEKYQVDAIFSLEYFDTDAKASFRIRNYEANGPLGVKVPMVEQIVTINTLVKSGWRIYDPSYVSPIDQSVYSIPLTSSGRGINPMTAFNTVKNRKSRVWQECQNIGINQAKRINEYWIRVSRDYYVSGSKRFKTGKRMAQTGNWDGAKLQWEKELTNPKDKIAGRAHYNMAISSEINGFIDDAIDYASKGYELYNNKLCLKYVKILRSRKQRLQRAEQLK